MLKMLDDTLNREENLNIENVILHQAAATQLPFEDGTLDAVFMVAVLSEIPDVKKHSRGEARPSNPTAFWR